MQHVLGAGFQLRVWKREFLDHRSKWPTQHHTDPGMGERVGGLTRAARRLHKVGVWCQCLAYTRATPTLTACFFIFRRASSILPFSDFFEAPFVFVRENGMYHRLLFVNFC